MQFDVPWENHVVWLIGREANGASIELLCIEENNWQFDFGTLAVGCRLNCIDLDASCRKGMGEKAW